MSVRQSGILHVFASLSVRQSENLYVLWVWVEFLYFLWVWVWDKVKFCMLLWVWERQSGIWYVFESLSVRQSGILYGFVILSVRQSGIFRVFFIESKTWLLLTHKCKIRWHFSAITTKMFDMPLKKSLGKNQNFWRAIKNTVI